MERIDFIPKHPELKIIQNTDMFLINSDTEVLGEFLNIKKTDRVIDIGTNTGGLMLYASLHNPKEIVGLDINSKALEYAKRNMELNNITNYKLINANLLEYKADALYDVVIFNPPYFETEESNKSKNEFKNLAKHESILKLSNMVKALSGLLRDSGTLYFLFLSSRMQEVMIELKKNNLYVKEMKCVYDINKDNSNVFMVKAVKNAKFGMNVKKPVIIKR